jgi:HD-GYP domain-containing protein (c-di-GMP phosphodiesterase class II)
MTVSKGVFSASSQALISAGLTITEKLLNQVAEIELATLIVEDDRLLGIPQPEFVSEEFFHYAVSHLYEMYRGVRSGVDIDVNKAFRIAYELVDEVCATPFEEQMLAVQINRTLSCYLYEHLVQVASLAIAVGRQLSYKTKQLRELALSALLMDIGLMQVGQEVMEAKRRFTRSEQDEMKKHSKLGYLLTRKYINIPLDCAIAILHHGERYNGSGYPQSMSDEDMHPYAKILAVCDTFDALITERQYRRRYLSQQALGILSAGINQTYSEEVVQAFQTIVAPYPIGSVVELNTKDMAIVVDVNRENKSRPVVRLILDRRRYLIDGIMEVDLVDSPDLHITRTLEDISIPVMWKSTLY